MSATIARTAGLLLGLLGSTAAWAQQAELRLEAEQIAVGERVPFAVIVSGGEARGVPRVAAQDGLTTTFRGQSQTMTYVNGQTERYTKFQFEVSATQPGPLTLGPAYAQTTGAGAQRTLTTNTVELLVRPADQATAAAGDDLTVETSFDRDEAWQGEVVLYHQVLRSRLNLAQARWLGTPTEGLLAPRDGPPETREYVLEDAQGKVLVNEQWVPLVTTETGDKRWPAPALEAQVVVDERGPSRLLRFFSQTRRDVRSGQPLRLKVKPLPPAPPDFSGLVGTFQLTQRLDSTRPRVGDSLNWTVFLDGDGTLEGYSLPSVGEVDGLRIYDKGERPRAVTRRGSYKAGLTFERTVVPTREGRLKLPTLRVTVFHTGTGTYETLELPGATLEVSPGEGGDVGLKSFGPEGTPVVEVAEDEGVRPLRTTGPGRRLPWLAWLPLPLALAALPTLSGLGAGAAEALQAYRVRRRETAVRPPTPRERLDRLPEDPRARLDALDAVLRAALAEAAGVPLAGLDRAAALAALPPELAETLEHATQALDRVRFANDTAPGDLEDRVRRLVHDLEAL